MQISAKTYFQDITQAKKPNTGKTIEASKDTNAIFEYLIDQVESFDFKKPRRIHLFEEKYQFKLDQEKSNDFTVNRTDSLIPYWNPKNIVFNAVSKNAPIQSIEFTEPKPDENQDERKPTNKYSMIVIRFLNNGSISYFPEDRISKRTIATQDISIKNNDKSYPYSASLLDIVRSQDRDLIKGFFLPFKIAFKAEVLDKKNFQGTITIKGEQYQIQDPNSARNLASQMAAATTPPVQANKTAKQDYPNELLLTPMNTDFPLKRVKVVFDRQRNFPMIFHFQESGSENKYTFTLALNDSADPLIL